MYMNKSVAFVVLAALVLVGCQADQSAFSPDISVEIRPQQPNVNINDDDVVVSVENVGDINAFDVEVTVVAGGRQVLDEVISSFSAGEEEVFRLTTSDLSEYCDSEQVLLEAEAQPSVKDTSTSNNEASIQLVC